VGDLVTAPKKFGSSGMGLFRQVQHFVYAAILTTSTSSRVDMVQKKMGDLS
jgi:hypothetical protein